MEFLAEHPPVEHDSLRGVEMCELAFWGHVNLRGDSGDEAFQGGVEKAVGARVPVPHRTPWSRPVKGLSYGWGPMSGSLSHLRKVGRE